MLKASLSIRPRRGEGAVSPTENQRVSFREKLVSGLAHGDEEMSRSGCQREECRGRD